MSIIEECNWVLRLRYQHNRRPKYFYMAPETRDQLWMEIAQLNGMHGCSAPMCSPDGHLFVKGLEAVMLDLPPGYILASETRLH